MTLDVYHKEIFCGLHVHLVSDYKKCLYKKRLVDLGLTKKRILDYFSDLRNAICRKPFLLQQLENLILVKPKINLLSCKMGY